MSGVFPDAACCFSVSQVNGHDKVIHLLLDMGVDIDKLNCEGMSALAVCHVLYYHYQSVCAAEAEATALEVTADVEFNIIL